MAGANHFKLGLFVITATALGLAGLGLLGAGALLRQTVGMETYLAESVQGLNVGADVKIRGVTIGRVSRIDFVTNKYDVINLSPEDRFKFAGLILVEFEVDRAFMAGREVFAAGIDGLVSQAVERGLRARMTSSGLTGPPFLSLDFMDPVANPAPDFPWQPQLEAIPSAPSTMNRFVSAAENILASIEDANIHLIAADIRKALHGLDGTLEQMNLADVANQATTLIAELRQTNATLQTSIEGLRLDELSDQGMELIAELRRTSTALSKALESDELARGLAEAPQALADLRRLIRRADTLTATQSDDLRSIIQNLRSITDNLRTLSESAKEYPSQLLLGEPPTRD